jgi:hypothetical protein
MRKKKKVFFDIEESLNEIINENVLYDFNVLEKEWEIQYYIEGADGKIQFSFEKEYFLIYESNLEFKLNYPVQKEELSSVLKTIVNDIAKRERVNYLFEEKYYHFKKLTRNYLSGSLGYSKNLLLKATVENELKKKFSFREIELKAAVEWRSLEKSTKNYSEKLCQKDYICTIFIKIDDFYIIVDKNCNFIKSFQENSYSSALDQIFIIEETLYKEFLTNEKQKLLSLGGI